MNNTPDLQSILATLARYSTTNGALTPSTAPGIERSGASGANTNPPAIVRPQDPRTSRTQEAPSVIAPPKPIDPSTITTWSEGLRCVTKIAGQNPQFVPAIKRMMQDQRSHEMRWYSERQALKQTQINRATSSAKATSILQSLNPSFVATQPQSAGQTEAEKAAELATFDRKIYSAQTAMDSVMGAELKSLGVPFFGTNPDLITPDNATNPKPDQPEDQPKWSVTITESELLELRRRMIGHLEDLYRD